jgi:hypothetical protein
MCAFLDSRTSEFNNSVDSTDYTNKDIAGGTTRYGGLTDQQSPWRRRWRLVRLDGMGEMDYIGPPMDALDPFVDRNDDLHTVKMHGIPYTH